MISTVACGETYLDVEKMIFHLGWKAARKFGGEFDEFASVGRLAFMRSYRSFDRAKGTSFVTYCYRCVWNAMLDSVRREGNWHKHRLLSDDVFEVEQPAGGLANLLSLISEDGHTIMNLLFESPPEIRRVLQPEGASRVRRSLWRRVKELGWSMSRCLSAFQEIEEALA